MGLLGNVIGGVVASRMSGRGGQFGGGFGGGLGGAMLGGRGRRGGSPVMTGLMLLLAARAAQSYMERRNDGAAPSPAGRDPGRSGGGLLAGVAGGGGLGALIEQFTRAGHGDAVDSWIRPGPNQKLAPDQLAQALGPETVQALKAETGLEEEELLGELSETLPEAVDQLTPDGVEPDPALLAGDDEDMAIVRASSA